ncbi:hypothetical protein CEXT_785281 [Caerostris extrusa]|uniref:Uncharacterized protein n=1 Tax=Caerostris extrusa TaxID=172846 RepID=A0AAV4U597_CAEEX|nr:hypothetical protein CEXT_785281 [Caerostris extrusa]
MPGVSGRNSPSRNFFSSTNEVNFGSSKFSGDGSEEGTSLLCSTLYFQCRIKFEVLLHIAKPSFEIYLAEFILLLSDKGQPQNHNIIWAAVPETCKYSICTQDVFFPVYSDLFERPLDKLDDPTPGQV